MLNLFRKKHKTEDTDELNISDGEIVAVSDDDLSEEPLTEESLLDNLTIIDEPEPTQPDPIPDTSGQIDQIEAELEPDSSLPIVIPDVPDIELNIRGESDRSDTPTDRSVSQNQYPPCYLIDGDDNDYAVFCEHLRASGKARGTQHEYSVVLRRWRKAFEAQRNGHMPDLSVDLLNRIFAGQKDSVALQMKYTLSAYAHYRQHIGDPRLLYLLTVHKSELHAPTPKTVKRPTRKSTDNLSEAEAQNYEDLGRYLIKQDKREGIWLLLCLWGVKPSEIKEIEFPNKSNIGFVRGNQVVKIPVPKWFMDACLTFPNWRLNRQNIHKGLMTLEVAPRVLNAVAKRRECEAERQKKQQQKDLEKMVQRWRKKRPQPK